MSGSRHTWHNNALPLLVCLLLSLNLSGCGWNPFHSSTTPSTPTLVEEAEDPIPQKEVSLFFNHGTIGELDTVNRTLPDDLNRQPIRFAVGELLKGPRPEEKKQGFFTEIPAGTELLGVSRHGSTITVDLSQKFTHGGGSTSMTQRIEELKRTVYALDKRHQLSVSVEGKPLELLGGEGLEVNDTLKRQAQ
jgi:spore germination protein GerM